MVIDKSKMTGGQLFDYYTSVHEDREYGSTLLTAHSEIGNKLFPMLEKCEREGKRIALQETMSGVLDPPLEVVLI